MIWVYCCQWMPLVVTVWVRGAVADVVTGIWYGRGGSAFYA